MGQYESQWGKNELSWGESILRCYNGLWLGKTDKRLSGYLNFMRTKRDNWGEKSKKAPWQGSNNENKAEKH